MTIKVGDKMPSGTLTLITKDGPQKVSADEYFQGKKVVLFSVPGAFTPTCDAKHLPGFVERRVRSGVRASTHRLYGSQRCLRDEGLG